MTAPMWNDRVSAHRRLIQVRAAVLRLAGVLRSSRVYSTENRALVEGVESSVERMVPLVEELGELVIRVEGLLVRVNGTIVAQLGDGALRELGSFSTDLQARGLGGLHFRSTPSTEDLTEVVALWRAHDSLPPDRGADILNEALRDSDVESLVFLAPRDPNEELVELGPDTWTPEDGLRAYCSLLTVAELMVVPATASLPATLGRAEAALHVAADLVAAAPEALMCAATHRDPERYSVVHAANTAVLSMLLARAIGLGLDGILDCGRGALFCDVGMMSAAAGAHGFPGVLNGLQMDAVLSHPLESFAAALHIEEMGPAARARLAVAWEHHCGVDGDGYPGPAPGAGPHLYARIVSIADGYDALVHDRGDRAGLPRPLALEVLYQEADRRFDRALLHEFCAMLGRFPPGSVVRLKEGHIAMTAAPSWEARMFDRPSVLIIRDPAGRRLRPEPLDLARQLGERSTRITHVLDDRLFPERLIELVLAEDVD